MSADAVVLMLVVGTGLARVPVPWRRVGGWLGVDPLEPDDLRGPPPE